MTVHFLRTWFRVIRSHPLRNILLILTTAIGTGALALSFQTTARLDRLVEETTGGADKRVVIANAEIGADGELAWKMPFQFNESWRDLIASEVKGVKSVSVVNQLPMQQIQVNNTYWKPSGVIGTDEHYAAVMGLDFVEGSFFSQANLKARDKVMVLSERAAVMLFGSAAEANGKTIAVDNGFRMMGGGMAGGRGANAVQQMSPWSNYTVVGVYADPTRFEAENYGISDYITPYTSMLPSGMNFNMPVRMFAARVSSVSIESIESAVRTRLDEESGEQVKVAVWEGSPSNPGVSTIEKARQSLNDLSLVTSGLGFLILIIAAFGIVSGLLVDAADRAKEIALKRAIGMTIVRGTVDLSTRSMALAGAGGFIGLVIATILSAPMHDILIPYLEALGITSGDLTSRLFEIRTLLAPVAALSLAFVFSLLPAARAASSSIVEGLKQ